MGSSCCIPKALSGAIVPDENLPSDIIHITESTSPEILSEFLEIVTVSFAGSTTAAPEGALSWVIDPSASGKDPCTPLLEEPSQSRLEFFRYLMRFGLETALRHGGCYAMTENSDGSGKLVAVTITFLPNDQHLYKTGLCEIFKIVRKIGIQSDLKSGPKSERMNAVDKVMTLSHANHASGRHLYIMSFAVSGKTQGKGYGRRLMTFLTSAANDMGVDCYLECTGERNERFYSRNGFELKAHYPLECQGVKFREGATGMAAMVRHPVP